MDFKSRGKGKRVQSVDRRGVESDFSNKDKMPVFSDKKRKRIYADKFPDGKLINRMETRNLYGKGKIQTRDDSVKVRSFKGPPRTIWVPNSVKADSSRNKHLSHDIIDETGNMKFSAGKQRTKAEEADKLDGRRNSVLQKQSKKKSDSSNHPYVPHSRSTKKIVLNKQSLVDGSSEVDTRPKKKKPKIRLDPYDISNKRLDDEVVTHEHVKEKKEESVKEVEMSMNAQFRAIKPSPSILSYVEDNLLGRRRMIELKRAGYNIELSAPLDNIPFSTSSERERIEENVFRNKMTFFAAAKVSSSFPAPDLPEIAFAGRSNVGKSSLLNCITRQWGVARTSDKPGLTQTINFFNLESKLCLVDLPGYGFAYAKEEVKDAWEDLVKEYVSTRVGLKQVCLLIDTKWGMKPRDRELIDLMERSQTKYQIVLTKTDLVFPIDVARRAMQIEESLKANRSIVQPVVMASSKTGAGIRSLRTVLSKIARFAKL
ncbi:uncharacterized protein LOC126670432 [Mercurialis annua]|uniref:uncharacterized protein LOC126670432 n=1 Tax=Mercurialis annua TaxID=3986 RepID=UPI00216022C0|nr:uncharacterized protein LOC126670432 [Mercurialis annua]